MFHVILLHDKLEKSSFVSSQHRAGRLGMIFNQNCFAISVQKLVAQICGYEIHHVEITSFLHKNSDSSVMILKKSFSFSILVTVCQV